MVAAGLLARKAVERGLTAKPWVKTTLAPGSKVVTDYYERAGLTPYLDKLGFNLVGYGCTTCIGNTGPLLPEISAAINDRRPRRRRGAVGQPQLRGPHQPRRAHELPRPRRRSSSPTRWPGTMDIDLNTEPLGTGADGQPSSCKDIWPSRRRGGAHDRARARVRRCSPPRTARSSRATSAGSSSPSRAATRYAWDATSTYVRKPPFFDGIAADAGAASTDIAGARVLAVLGDSVTTDHISPAGNIRADSPAGR